MRPSASTRPSDLQQRPEARARCRVAIARATVAVGRNRCVAGERECPMGAQHDRPASRDTPGNRSVLPPAVADGLADSSGHVALPARCGPCRPRARVAARPDLHHRSHARRGHRRHQRAGRRRQQPAAAAAAGARRRSPGARVRCQRRGGARHHVLRQPARRRRSGPVVRGDGHPPADLRRLRPRRRHDQRGGGAGERPVLRDVPGRRAARPDADARRRPCRRARARW